MANSRLDLSNDKIRQVSDTIVGMSGVAETLFLLAEREEVTAKDMLDVGIAPEDIFRIVFKLEELKLITLAPNACLTSDGQQLASKLWVLSGDSS